MNRLGKEVDVIVRLDVWEASWKELESLVTKSVDTLVSDSIDYRLEDILRTAAERVLNNLGIKEDPWIG